MGYAIIEKATRNAISWARWDVPPHDPELHDIVEAESLEDAKPQSQIDAEAKSEAIREIKAQAHADIIAIMPEYAQRNALARTIELQDKKIAGLELAIDEMAELETYRQKWDQIRQIRQASNEAEAAL